MSEAFFVKVEEPDFQLPQVVLDHLVLPPVEPGELEAAVADYLAAHPPSTGEPLLVEHVAALEPHPAYDDLPSFAILFENGLA